MDEILNKARLSTPEDIKERGKRFRKEREEYIQKFIDSNLKFYDKADENVLRFIANFLYHGDTELELKQSAECIRHQFRAGYCYFFAQMLKDTFNRGTVCWAAPFSHIVWVDDVEDVPYDIEGIHNGETEEYIPISWLGEHILGFKHYPGYTETIKSEEIDEIIDKWRAMN